MIKLWLKYVTFFFIIVSLTSCTLYEPRKRGSIMSGMPGKFSLYEKAPPAAEKWWSSFKSPELNGLMETALKDNLDIALSGASLSQAIASAVKTGAARWPDVNIEAGSSNTRTKQIDSSGDKSSSYYEAGIAASYELDLWGRVKSVTESAKLDLRASREDLITAATTMVVRYKIKAVMRMFLDT